MLETVVALFWVTAEWSSVSIPTTSTDKAALSSDHGNLSFMHICNRKKPPQKVTSPFQGQKIHTLLLLCLLLLANPTVQSLLSFYYHYLALLPSVFHLLLPPTSSALFSLPLTDPTQFFSTHNTFPHTGKLQLLSDFHLFLHITTSSPRNLFLLPTLKMEAESSPKHWQQITIQHSHIPVVYNLQQQCHGNLKPQNLYTYRVYHIKHTLTL